MKLFRKSATHRKESAMGAATLGCLFCVIALPTLFLNEGRAVKTTRSLKEGSNAVVHTEASCVNAENEGKFVHISGKAETEETLVDEQFGVAVKAIRLERIVETYQWKEVQEKVTRRGKNGRSTTETEYRYEKVWSADLIDSSRFRKASAHTNPTSAPFASATLTASEVRIGAFVLPHDLVDRVKNSEPVLVDLAHVPSSIVRNVRPEGGSETSAKGIYWSSTPDSSRDQPAIGDAKIRFHVTRATEVSVMAQQDGNTFRPFETQSGQRLSMLTLGSVSADSMIQQAESQNVFFTWGLRILGTALLMVGISLVLRLLTTITHWIPFVDGWVDAGAAVVAALLGGGLALFTIALAWLFFRPLLAAMLIGAGMTLLWYLFRYQGTQVRSSEVPPPLPTA